MAAPVCVRKVVCCNSSALLGFSLGCIWCVLLFVMLDKDNRFYHLNSFSVAVTDAVTRGQ